MKPILFVINKFSFNTFLLLTVASVITAWGIFIYFRKKVVSVKNLRNLIFQYLIFFIVILGLLYKFGPFPVRTYGVAVASAFLASIFIARYMSQKSNINPDYILDLGVYVLIGVIIGARLFYIIFYDWSYFMANPLKMFAVWEGGLVFYGGFFGGIVAGYYFVVKKKLNVLKMADIIGVALPLGLFFGRWGCFGYGCCFGKVAPQNFPFAIRFPAKNPLTGYTPAFEKHLHEGLVTLSDKFSLPVYPTQLISSLNGLLIFLFLFWLYKKKKFDGQIAALSVILYSITRFLIELLRVEPKFLGISVSQWISVFTFAFGIWLYKYSVKIKNYDTKRK